MLSLSARKYVSKVILEYSKYHAIELKGKLKVWDENYDDFNAIEENANRRVILKEYLDNVTNSVFSVVERKSPTGTLSAIFLLSSPSICGYKDIDFEKGVKAGAVYAMCYYLLTNKKAKPRHCQRLNRKQADIITWTSIHAFREKSR